MTPEDLDIMKRNSTVRLSFLERRQAKIYPDSRATVDYGTITLLIIREPRRNYDRYILQSFYKTLGTFKHGLLSLMIPKIPYGPGFFDMFGERIEDEKDKKIKDEKKGRSEKS